MGAAESKPEGYSWKASGPPSVSTSMIDSLQSSPETDASRTRLLEQHIQARVGQELKRLSSQESDALKLAQDKIAEAAAGAASTDDESGRPSSYTLSREIGDLRQRLEKRKNVKDLPQSVAAARSNVIRCLRENDRRPLDCYEEVQAFKAEVNKMERDWVKRVTA